MSMAALSLTLPNGLSSATTTELLSGCQFNTSAKLNKARMTRSVKPLHVPKLSTRARQQMLSLQSKTRRTKRKMKIQ